MKQGMRQQGEGRREPLSKAGPDRAGERSVTSNSVNRRKATKIELG